MRGWLAAICGVLLSCGCDSVSLPGRPLEEDRPLRPEEVVDFDALYGNHCAGCHGAGGRLGAARPLNDPLYLALVPPGEIERIVGRGIEGTGMPAFAIRSGGLLTDVQIATLERGMRATWGRPQQFEGVRLPVYRIADAPSGVAERGETVFAAFCAGCHGAEGGGGGKAGSVVAPAFLALVSDQGLRTTVLVGREDLNKPDWRGNVPGRPMSAAEIADVVAWLVAQRPEL